jgi:WD40 repeat protein
VTTVKDGHYLVAKTYARSAYALEVDLNAAEQQAPTDATLHLLNRSIARISHLLVHCKTQSEVVVVLYGRLLHLQELSDVCAALQQDLPRLYLKPWHPLPDLKASALIRTLQGHTDEVWGCAVSPTGDFIVSASRDHTLKVWDAQTGTARLTLIGHTDAVWGCAISPACDFVASASADRMLKLWDVHTGTCLTTLPLNGFLLACAFCPDGNYIVVGGEDGVYFLQLVRQE